MHGFSLSDVHSWLKSEGFSQVTSETRFYVYEGVLKCNQITVPVQLRFENLNFIDLPEILLRDPRPPPLQRPLPHVDTRGKLCYLDAETHVFDRYQPVVSMATVLAQAQQVLVDSLTGNNANDVGYEFSAYWDALPVGVLISDLPADSISRYGWHTCTSATGDNLRQIVIGDSADLESHISWLGGELITSEQYAAVRVKMARQPLLPVTGTWPPENVKEFYAWLKANDPKAAGRLYRLLGMRDAAKFNVLIVLSYPDGHVGLEIRIPKSLRSSTQDPSRFRKFLLKDTGRHGTKVTRIHIDDARPKRVTTRNLVGKGLAGKRIALIGCGTIGGHLARLLVQTGAGTGLGELVLYDGGFLSAGNIGRHYLDGRYLNENKAEACRHKLTNEFPHAQIRANGKHLTYLSALTRQHLVIDATGYEAFSIELNHQALKLRSQGTKNQDILYVWVDGNGVCARTLHFDGTGACYRCMRNQDGKDRFPPLKSGESLIAMRHQCGESYQPYPPSTSLQAAAMGLEAVLGWVNGNPSPRFRSRGFDGSARTHKNRDIAPLGGCPACQN